MDQRKEGREDQNHSGPTVIMITGMQPLVGRFTGSEEGRLVEVMPCSSEETVKNSRAYDEPREALAGKTAGREKGRCSP